MFNFYTVLIIKLLFEIFYYSFLENFYPLNFCLSIIFMKVIFNVGYYFYKRIQNLYNLTFSINYHHLLQMLNQIKFVHLCLNSPICFVYLDSLIFQQNLTTFKDFLLPILRFLNYLFFKLQLSKILSHFNIFHYSKFFSQLVLLFLFISQIIYFSKHLQITYKRHIGQKWYLYNYQKILQNFIWAILIFHLLFLFFFTTMNSSFNFYKFLFFVEFHHQI